jgi:hypothetical protein
MIHVIIAKHLAQPIMERYRLFSEPSVTVVAEAYCITRTRPHTPAQSLITSAKNMSALKSISLVAVHTLPIA